MHFLKLKFALFLLCAFAYAPQAYSQHWWHCDWPYRTELSIEASSTHTNKTVHIQLNGSDFNANYSFTPDGADLRVWDAEQSTALPFFIEYWNPSTKEVTINVKMPSLSSMARTLYIYYGNTTSTGASAVSPLSDANHAFTATGWRYHTKRSTLNPSNEQQARSEFEQSSDSTSGYGCAISSTINGKNNRNTFNGPAGSYGLYAETLFLVNYPGQWEFRAGLDFGRGGGLYVNDRPIEENWNTDLWWAGNYNNADVLKGSITLSTGYHHIEVFGFEGCCDGTIGVQYRRPGSRRWYNFDTRTLSLVNLACPNGSITDTFIQSEESSEYSGHVFLDNGVQGIAHDALKHSNEPALANIDVTVTVVSTGANFTATSNTNGEWSDCIAGSGQSGGLRISTAPSEQLIPVSEGIAGLNTDKVLNSIIEFTPLTNTPYTDINFGYIEEPSLSTNRSTILGAGESQSLSHIYTATTTAQVNIDISERIHEQAFNFSYNAYRDANCDGVLGAGDTPLQNPINVLANQNICFLLNVTGNANVVPSSSLELKIDAHTNLGPNLQILTNTNIDSVTGDIPFKLSLEKAVCNASQSTCNVVTGEGFSINTTGAPNEELIYRMRFSSAKAALSDVVVNDVVPAFTTMKPASAMVATEPNGVSCSVTKPTDHKITHYTGNVEWSCNGTIQPSQSGIVSFAVIVD